LAGRVILIGFMGAGKTAVGKRVARKLGWEFLDADSMVENTTGMSIEEIFSKKGEAAFREIEETVVMDMLDSDVSGPGGKVISLGGGAVTSNKILRRLMDEPLVFFLDLDVETAFDRAQNGARPLARDRDGFVKLFEQREELYRSAAGWTVDTRCRSISDIADEIISAVKEREDVS